MLVLMKRPRAGTPVAATVFLFLFTLLIDDTEAAGRRRCRRQKDVHMSATFSGTVVTMFVKRDTVQSWLPAGLRISDASPFEDHPVIILAGTQRNLTRHGRITIRPGFGRCYHETFIAVPYLAYKGSSSGRPVLHFVRLYSASSEAVTRGVRCAGWPKVWARIRSTRSNYCIATDPAAPRWNATFDHANAAPVAYDNESIRQIHAMLSQTTVLEHQGVLESHRVRFHFNTGTIRSVSAEAQIGEEFLPNLGPMRTEASGIDQQEFGAFYVTCAYSRVKL